jgi:hypothetical protein
VEIALQRGPNEAEVVLVASRPRLGCLEGLTGAYWGLLGSTGTYWSLLMILLFGLPSNQLVSPTAEHSF